ncbi:MAG: RIP metalloprotease RseP [Sphingomonadaceae bacterium]
MIEAPGFWWSAGCFLAVIGPLVFLHEMGHYLVGRWCGVKADTFSVGFGKELFGWTDARGTRWKLSAIPLGGYVKFAGDLSAASEPNEEWKALPAAERAVTFQAQTLWKRALIIAAGPVTNLLVAALIFVGIFAFYGELRTPPTVASVLPASAAATAGIKPGDKIVAIDGSRITQFSQIGDIAAIRPGVPLRFEIERAAALAVVTVTPIAMVRKDIFGNQARIGQLGIGSGRPERVMLSPIELPGAALHETARVLFVTADGLAQIFRGRVSVKELGGPIKIAKFSGQVATLGIVAFLGFMALISINLGFINLLPIPMLDGGHLTFYAVEAILRKPVSQDVQEWAYRAGFAVVIGFMLLVNFNDLESSGVLQRLSSLIG